VGILFTVAANHLNSEISQSPDYQLSRKFSAVATGGGRGGSGCYGGCGGRGSRTGSGRGGRGGQGNAKANTGYYSPTEWEKLSFDELDKIRKESDKKGEQGGSKRSISEMTTKQTNSHSDNLLHSEGNGKDVRKGGIWRR
jgi:hypothetical protein